MDGVDRGYLGHGRLQSGEEKCIAWADTGGQQLRGAAR